jgi:hypothetical protein
MSWGKIWAGPDKRLIYDPAGAKFESGALHFYNGAEDQMPDALMESYMGAGQVPAYRGYAYIVVEMFDVSQHDGNRIPFLTIEVGREGEATPPPSASSSSTVCSWGRRRWSAPSGAPTSARCSTARVAFMHRREITLASTSANGQPVGRRARHHDPCPRAVGHQSDWLTTQVMGTGNYEVHTPFTVPSGETLVGAALNAGPRLVVACRLNTGGTRFHFIDPDTWAEVMHAGLRRRQHRAGHRDLQLRLRPGRRVRCHQRRQGALLRAVRVGPSDDVGAAAGNGAGRTCSARSTRSRSRSGRSSSAAPP